MDSFFDFDTSLPPVDEQDGLRSGRRKVDSEDEYDALNDETFGDPDKGDWENMHETLVRLEKGPDYSLNDDRQEDALFDDDELDLHLSRFDFCDGDESIGSTADLSLDDDIGSRLRLDPSIWDSPVKKSQPVQQVNRDQQNLFPILPPIVQQNGVANAFRPNNCPIPQAPIKMLSVEDIERNIIQQQQQQLQQRHQEQLKKEREQLHQQQQKVLQENQKNKAPRKVMVPLVTPALQSMVPPAQLLAIRNQMFPHPQLLSHPQARMPLGFLPYNFLPPPFSTPINNLAMHPGFPAAAQLGMFPHQRIPLPVQPNIVQNLQNNQFNKRLVQEIQQNHPLLALNRQNHQYNNNNQSGNQKRFHNAVPKGPDYDEYANLMSNREKQWLIGIQLTQLNSDAPYINDYYFTVYKERLAARNGNRESKAYKDNQLNHPFTQPTGHAQLLLMSSLAKNCGMLNAKGGLINRERHNSESKNNNSTGDQKDQPARTYTPLQFENSLGKLQCGSVTAPRKIIDMDVVGAEPTQAGTTTTRELLHRLLHIETLYKVVLKMEDLNNPVAIEAALLAKEKREKERHEFDSTNSSLSSSAESFDELLAVLIAGLAQDKVIPMLGVRKGKILLRRILVLLRDHPYRWTLWITVFSTVPFLLKKDRDDSEGVLFALYTEFERHVQYSQFPDLLKLSQILTSEKILSHLTTCKFLLSSIITLIFQMEIFFSKSPHAINSTEQKQWIDFLKAVTNITSKQATQQIIKIDHDNNIVRTIRAHLERFPVNGSDFVRFITTDEIDKAN